MRRTLLLLAFPLALAGCPEPKPDCSPAGEKASAQALMQSWYLYPELLPAIDPTDPAYATVQDYLDALTAGARAQGEDRYWTYATTATQATQFFDEGVSTGFGLGTLVRTAQDATNHWLVTQVFPFSAAAGAGFARGDEILAIGETEATLADVPTQLTRDEVAAWVGNAIGPAAAGVKRAFRVQRLDGTIEVRSATKGTYGIDPVPQGFGVVQGAPGPVGYVALRAFVSPADPQLQAAFQQLQDAHVQDVIVDLRYNGGGRISTAYLLANLLGGARSASDVMFSYQYNPYHQDRNATATFARATQAVSPLRVAFITTGASASASELVPNALEAYLGTDVALVGDRTYGKPVGQQPFQLRGCDLVVNVVALRIVNRDGNGDYFGGLPADYFTGPLCPAEDDLAHAPGDPAEASTAAALSWIATGSCGGAVAAKPSGPAALRSALPAQDAYPEAPAPDEAQRHVRGLF